MKIIIILLGLVNCCLAQEPPMPPTFGWTNIHLISTNYHFSQVYNSSILGVRPSKTYTALCPHCNTKRSKLNPYTMSTNGSVVTNGGYIISRILSFSCPDCQEKFDSKNTVFQPESIAIEDVPPIPTMPFGPLTQTNSTWTTNANLKLSIKIQGKGLTWPSLIIPSSVFTGTVMLSIGPLALVSFPTEVGKSYKCQATDDAKKTWLDGVILAGTGQPLTNTEAAIKPSRMYRVLEQ